MHAFEFYGPLFARWLQEQNEGRPVRWEKVEPGDEQILPPREQREMDGVPAFLALRD
jgi:heme oxygenase